MKCMKCVVAVLVMGIATSSQAMQFPEISEQKIASAMSLVSLGVAAYNQLGKFLKDPDVKQLKYQKLIQSFLDNAGMATDQELQEALALRDARLNRLESALNLLLDDKKEEARAALLSAELTTNRNTPDSDLLSTLQQAGFVTKTELDKLLSKVVFIKDFENEIAEHSDVTPASKQFVQDRLNAVLKGIDQAVVHKEDAPAMLAVAPDQAAQDLGQSALVDSQEKK